MIESTLNNCAWGVDVIDIDEKRPEQGGGIRVNLLDQDSKQLFHIPFTGEALPQLVAYATRAMLPEQKLKVQEIIDEIIAKESGIALPSDADVARANGTPSA